MTCTRRYLLNCLSSGAAVGMVLPAAAVGLPDAGFNPASLEAVVRGEFAAGRIVRVDGWLLAETEARLCGYCG